MHPAVRDPQPGQPLRLPHKGNVKNRLHIMITQKVGLTESVLSRPLRRLPFNLDEHLHRIDYIPPLNG